MKTIKIISKNTANRGIVKRRVVIPKASVNKNERLQLFIQNLSNVPRAISKNLGQDQKQDTTGNMKICWHTVCIKTGSTVTNSSIMLAIGWILRPVQITPYNFQRINNQCQFFVDDLLVARGLMRSVHVLAEQYISEPLEVGVYMGLPSDNMNPKITMELVTGIRSALKANYDASNRCLDLTHFHRKIDIFCPLYVEKLLKCVLQLILQEVPMVNKIVLKNNNMCSLLAFKCITYAYPQLETLDLSFNNIKIFDELPSLVTLKVNTLILSGNVVGKHTNLTKLKKILPNTTLICNELPDEPDMEKQPIDVIKSPTSFPLPKFEPNSNAIAIEFFSKFYQTYYPLFDKREDRSGLCSYYESDAAFSLSVSDKLLHVDAYNHYNRNQSSMIADFNKLQIGGPAIVQALKSFPEMQSQHKDSTLSVLKFTDNIRAFVLTGSFMELTESGWTKRQFQRTIILNLSETGSWLISNDLLCITMPPEVESTKMEEESIDTNEPNKIKNDVNFDEINQNMKQLILTNPEESIAGQSSLRSNMISPIPSLPDSICELIIDDEDSLDLGIDIEEEDL